jgi:hypothetical protein
MDIQYLLKIFSHQIFLLASSRKLNYIRKAFGILSLSRSPQLIRRINEHWEKTGAIEIARKKE